MAILQGSSLSRRYLIAGILLILVRLSLDGMGVLSDPLLQLLFVLSGIALSTSAALGLREKWAYGFARGLIGLVAALLIGLPAIGLARALSGWAIGPAGTYGPMAGIAVAVALALKLLLPGEA